MTAAANSKNFFASNLLQLQNKIKRDPTSYKDEVHLSLKLFFIQNSKRNFDEITLFHLNNSLLINLIISQTNSSSFKRTTTTSRSCKPI